MKKENTFIALLGFLAYNPDFFPEIKSRINPDKFPHNSKTLAKKMWEAYDKGEPLTPHDLRDFAQSSQTDILVQTAAEAALKQPLAQKNLTTAIEQIRKRWESEEMANIYRKASEIAETDATEARAYVLQMTEALEMNVVIDEKPAIIQRSFYHMNKYFETKPGKRVTGVPTGFYSVNAFTAGWQASDVNIISADPGAGKTTFTLQCALAAAREGHNVLFFSCGDSSAEALYMKAAGILANVDYNCIIRNVESVLIAGGGAARLAMAYQELELLPIEIVDFSHFSGTVGGLCDLAVQKSLKWNKGKTPLIVVDYIQQVRADKPTNSAVVDAEKVVAAINMLAKKHKFAILQVSQTSRDNRRGSGKRRPTNADLHGTSALEKDAARIFFLYKDPELGMQLMCTKDRHGGLKGEDYIYIPMNWRADEGHYEWAYDKPTGFANVAVNPDAFIDPKHRADDNDDLPF